MTSGEGSFFIPCNQIKSKSHVFVFVRKKSFKFIFYFLELGGFIHQEISLLEVGAVHIVMKRFEVVNGLQKQFEQSIKTHYEQLIGTRGYFGFHLIRGGTNGTVTFYSSHTKWANKKDFLKWGGKAKLCKMQSICVSFEPVKNRKQVSSNNFEMK